MMKTPVCDFVYQYAKRQIVRAHMPGHKGQMFLGYGQKLLGCERIDITEVHGADDLYHPTGILRKSEAHAAQLFRSAATLYSTEGSSQCIRAMLSLALANWRIKHPTAQNRPVLFAGRNAHKSLLLAAAMLDVEIYWLWSEEEESSLCCCSISPGCLEKSLAAFAPLENPIAVFVTTPDYLGKQLDVSALAAAAHQFDIPLLVDNAHGAYLTMLRRHPITLGADACCDSAHKTLPVLTGGAYLHIARSAPKYFRTNAHSALSLFGSTSPSWLILQSLDLCNRILQNKWNSKIRDRLERMEHLKNALREQGWFLLDTDPLKLTVEAAYEDGFDGLTLADSLRQYNIECEYAEQNFLTLMLSPANSKNDFIRIENAFAELAELKPPSSPQLSSLPKFVPEVACSIREAVLAPQELIPIEKAEDRIMGIPVGGCPPAVPLIMSGERIPKQAIDLWRSYHVETVSVVLEL